MLKSLPWDKAAVTNRTPNNTKKKKKPQLKRWRVLRDGDRLGVEVVAVVGGK
jgi:hypothetical protein